MWVDKLDTQESWFKASRPQTKEELMFQSKSEGGKTPIPSLKAVRQDEFFLTRGRTVFLFYLVIQQIGWGPPTLGRAICFTQSSEWNVNPMKKHPHRNTWNNIWPNIWATHGSVKLTHKTNHHRWWHRYTKHTERDLLWLGFRLG